MRSLCAIFFNIGTQTQVPSWEFGKNFMNILIIEHFRGACFCICYIYPKPMWKFVSKRWAINIIVEILIASLMSLRCWNAQLLLLLLWIFVNNCNSSELTTGSYNGKCGLFLKTYKFVRYLEKKDTEEWGKSMRELNSSESRSDRIEAKFVIVLDETSFQNRHIQLLLLAKFWYYYVAFV